jgi:hypothetical protein
MKVAKRWARSGAGLLALVASVSLTASACSSGGGQSGQSIGPTVVNHSEVGEIFDTLAFTDLKCTGTVHRFNGGNVAVCQPIASDPKAALSVAVYPNAAQAEAAFKANCGDGGLWNMYRTGENWRGAISTTGPPFPRDKALAIARAINTDAHKGCGPP